MKVHPFQIPKKPNENIILQTDRGTHFFGKLHRHEEIQLSYIVSGQGKLIVGNQIAAFNEGDLVAIGSGLPHLFQSNAETKVAHMISIFFTHNSFGEEFFNQQQMKEIRPVLQWFSHGLVQRGNDSFKEKIFLNLSSEDKFELFIKLLEILRYLAHSDEKLIVMDGAPPKISKNQGQRLRIVFDYVIKNFHKKIVLADVAEEVHMTKNSFCRFFKQRTNKAFFEFLAEIRIQNACELLKEQSDLPIFDIALQSGYSSISNFNKQFKEIKKMNPSQYRVNSLNKVS